MRDLTILKTAAGSPNTPGVVECLKNNPERKIRIIGTDMSVDPTIEQYIDKCYFAPPVSSPDYVDCLLDICKKENVDVLIPGISDELIHLCLRKKEFEEIGTHVSVANKEAIEICTNKRKLYDFLRTKSIHVPEYYEIHSLDELKNAVKCLGYPAKKVCVKATTGAGSRGVRILDSQKSRADILLYEKPNSLITTFEDLYSILSEIQDFPDMMAMEYLPGDEYAVDLLAQNGEVLYMCGRRNYSVNASIPMSGVVCVDKVALEKCKEIIKALNYSGNANFDFKYNQSDEPVLMELNPRHGATVAVFYKAGVNLLYMRVKQLLCEELPECKIEKEVFFKRRYHEYYSITDNAYSSI